MTDFNFTHEDRAAYPLTCAAREAFCGVSERRVAEYEEAARTAVLRLEKRAAAISLNMAKLSRTFVCFHYRRVLLAEQSAGNRGILEREGLFDRYVGDRAAFDALTPDEQAAWFQFAEASFMLHRSFVDPHLRKLAAARADSSPGAAEQTFESRIVLGTLYGILREWLAWWRENGTFPFEEWTYEDEPWADAQDAAEEA